jgi:[ribosomal protein S5]-alanine N-acetyltransferase
MPAVVPPGRLSGRAQPTLNVDELVLRPWRLADVPDVVAA